MSGCPTEWNAFVREAATSAATMRGVIAKAYSQGWDDGLKIGAASAEARLRDAQDEIRELRQRLKERA